MEELQSLNHFVPKTKQEKKEKKEEKPLKHIGSRFILLSILLWKNKITWKTMKSVGYSNASTEKNSTA